MATPSNYFWSKLIPSPLAYRNEEEVGMALKESGLSRKEIWITTKWSRGEKSARESCEESLSKMGIDYIDLYLIHSTGVCGGDIAGAWAQMEVLHREGKVKSIGVSKSAPLRFPDSSLSTIPPKLVPEILSFGHPPLSGLRHVYFS